MEFKEIYEIEQKLYLKNNLEKSIETKLKKISEYENGMPITKNGINFLERVQGSAGSIYKNSDLDIRYELINNLRLKILEDKKKLDVIEIALESIKDDKYYQIIELKYFKGFQLKEIAYKFGKTKMTILRQRNRLLRKIKALL